MTAEAREDPARWRALDRSEGLPSDDVLDLCASGQDVVWAATSAGLCRITRWEIELLGPPGVPRRLAPAPGGGVYALYADRIVELRDGAGVDLGLPVDPSRAPGLEIETTATGALRLRSADAEYHLSPDGSWLSRPRTDGTARTSPRPIPAAPVPLQRVIEHRGELWAATRGRGILRLRITPRFRPVPLPAAERVHALARAADGSVWCATENGIARVVDDAVVETVTEIGGEPLGDITACAIDRDGRLWIGSGSSFRGLYRRETDGWRRITTIPGYVHRISVDPTGALWFAVLNTADGQPGEAVGAWVFADGELRPAPAIAQLPSARVYDVVARDPSGVLWFATLKGLAAYRGGDGIVEYTPETFRLPGEKVWCLCAARDGSLWFGYQGEFGVSRLARGELTHYDVGDGLCDGNVWAIAEGRPGVFWFATRHGLSRYDGRRWSCFRAEDGLGVPAIWPLLPDPDGSLWIGTLGAGLVHLVPDDDQPPRTRFPGEEWRASAGDLVRIAWSGSDGWFDTPAAELWYRWRWDDGPWSAAAPEPSCTWTAESGRHRLEVQAIDRFGNVEDPPASLVLEVDPRVGPLLPLAAGAAALLAIGYLIGRRARRRGSSAPAS